MEWAAGGHQGEGLEPLQEFSSLFQEQRETEVLQTRRWHRQREREAQRLGAGLCGHTRLTCASGSDTTVRRVPHPKPQLPRWCNDANNPFFVQVVVNEMKQAVCSSKPVLITNENT